MILKNARIFQGERGFVRGSLMVEQGRIQRIVLEGEEEKRGGERALEGKKLLGTDGPQRGEEQRSLEGQERDLNGAYLLPGLIDLHTHGNSGEDFSDGSLEGLCRMGSYLAGQGITSFAPASMTLPYERLERAFQVAAEYESSPGRGRARLLGIHMEGPYFSDKKKGAQNGEYLRLPDAREVFRLYEASRGLLRIVDVAPELPGAEAFIREVGEVLLVSIAHTDASYDQARMAFEAGARHLTHLFNAMPSLHHRAPGVIAAAAEREDVVAELICDGLHVHPSMVRLAFRLFPKRVCLISDSLRCLGLKEGSYELGGQMVTLKGGEARLSDGTLAGAVSNLYTDMVNAIRFGIPAEEAITAATLVPARELGRESLVGSLEVGKRADLLVCDESWELQEVYLEGERI